jgi:TRAP-type mannitol/chloroaromatic compound transport system permease small subunit
MRTIGAVTAARTAVDRMVAAIEAASTAAGWLAAVMIVPMTYAIAHEVTARYVFNAPTRWAYHVTYLLYGAQFMLAGAHTLMDGGHIRTDVFYVRWSARTRARVDAAFYLLFFFPGLACVFYAGAVEAWQAWRIGERVGGWPAWWFEGIIPLTAALLVLQGEAELVKCGRVIRGGGR